MHAFRCQRCDDERGQRQGWVYLAHLVATEAGVSTDEAEKGVDTFIQTVKDTVQAESATDEARKLVIVRSLALG